MTKPDGIDQSWGFADPATAATAGIRVVSMYLSRDTSKNVTATDIKAYHAHGIGVLLNWEGQSGAPLLGAAQGTADAHDAVALVHKIYSEVGYKPKSKLALPFSCDRDTTPSNYPKIDAYYKATATGIGTEFTNGVYGEADLIDHLHAQHETAMEWQTYAWSGGRLSPEADFYQFRNGQKLGGADVDFDKIEHLSELGAWWPPNSPLNVPPGTHTPSTTSTTPEVPLSAAEVADIKAAITEAKTEILNVLEKSGVEVKGLLEFDHKAFPSIEGLLVGIPGYVPMVNRK